MSSQVFSKTRYAARMRAIEAEMVKQIAALKAKGGAASRTHARKMQLNLDSCSLNNLKKKRLPKWNSRAERDAATTNGLHGGHVLGGFRHVQTAFHSSGRWRYPPLDNYVVRFFKRCFI